MWGMKGHRAKVILQRTEKKLLGERIRQIHFTTGTLEAKCDQRMEELFILCSSEVREKVPKLVSRTQHTKVKKKRQAHKIQQTAEKNPP